jgi:enoyl-CoA hydratase
MKTILMGRPISAEEALNAGLVCDVFEDQALIEATVSSARELSKNAPIAAQLAKEAICRGKTSCLFTAVLAISSLSFAAFFGTGIIPPLQIFVFFPVQSMVA